MKLRIRIPAGAEAYRPRFMHDKATGDFCLVFDVSGDFAWHRPLRVAHGETIPGMGREESLDVVVLTEDEDEP